MQFDNYGNIVDTSGVPKGFLLNKTTGLLNKFNSTPKLGRQQPTKTARKAWRKESLAYRADGTPKPARKQDSTVGYEKFMNFLSRGCDVTTA